jgi:hypothetical protein
LNEIQEHIKQIYRSTKMGELFQMVIQLLSEFGIALTRNSELHSLKLKNVKIRFFDEEFGIALTQKFRKR